MAEWSEVFTKNIQAGVVPKPQPALTVRFPVPFTHPPAVIVSPEWTAVTQVVAIPTIHNVSTTSFTMNSVDAAPDYYINWLAIGNIGEPRE